MYFQKLALLVIFSLESLSLLDILRIGLRLFLQLLLKRLLYS